VRGLSGKRMVVSGASSGIGLAAAGRLLEEGCRVAFCAWDRVSEAEAALGEIGEVRGFELDVADEEASRRFLDAACEWMKGIDGCFSNAGIFRPAHHRDPDLDSWDAVMGVNLRGSYALCRAAASLMGEGGAIVATSSVNATAGEWGGAAYDASKAGVEAFVRALSIELGPRNIRVNAIAPGFTATPAITGEFSPREIEWMARHHTTLGRFARPEEIAAAVAFLLSDDAGYVTGATLRVDGGRLSRSAPSPGEIPEGGAVE
jgi:NAD(P)-dependent dehydrogenase (short-subunit alcohol dehydrogenase family)